MFATALSNETNVPTRNPNWLGLRCIRCAAVTAERDAPAGCPACAARGEPAAMACHYAPGSPPLAQPYLNLPFRGEGDTPVVALPRALIRAGGARVFAKLESANLTGSHKDRMAAIGVAHALAQERSGVIAASSGNAGLAVAAYAAAAGLRCEIVITQSCPPLYKALMQEHGARITIGASALDRWEIVRTRVEADPNLLALTNYMRPAVGSPPATIEGYKLIAGELVDGLKGEEIARVYVPVARGDLLFGLCLGFESLFAAKRISHIPKLIAVEPFARLARVSAGDDYRAEFSGNTAQFSTSGSTVTLQSVAALQRTQGHAIVIDDARAYTARALLARNGFSVELCAAAAYAAYADTPEPDADEGASVIIFTAHGSRDSLSISPPPSPFKDSP